MPSLLARDTRSIGLAMGIGVGVGVVANLVLAPLYASTGTAAAMALGQGVAFGLVALLGRSGVSLPMRWTWVCAAIGTASVLVVLFTVLALPLAARILLVVVFVVAIVLIYRPRNVMAMLVPLVRSGRAFIVDAPDASDHTDEEP